MARVVDIWYCQICSKANDIDTTCCYFCGGSQKSLECIWKCGNCELLNSNELTCDSCHAIKPNANTNKWACSKCTFHNDVKHHKCFICETSAINNYSPSGSKSLAIRKILPCYDKTKDLTCSQCNGRSPYFATNCDICGASKSELYVKKETISIGVNWEADSRNVETCSVCTAQYKANVLKCPICLTRKNSTNTMAELISDSDVSTSVEQQREEDEQESREILNRIIKTCRNFRDPFTDASFYPGAKSLYISGVYSGPQKEDPAKQWLRPSRVMKESDQRWTVFQPNKIASASDIIQGYLGNCWFLSALAVVTEYNQLIKNIMISQEFCPEGVYQVRLFIQGKWTTVVIDDLLPCDENGRLLYSQAKAKQLWVPLIEKATAKAFGCYEALVNGRCLQGLSTLTGFPCWSISLQNENSGGVETEVDRGLVWATLLSAKDQGYLMGASCGGRNMNLRDEEYDTVGLRPRHAYSVLDVEEVKTFNVNSSVRLLKLRNPWGRFEWNGDWSRNSPLWNGVYEHSTLNKGFQQGEFCISQEDFMKYFDSVDICKYMPNHNSETVGYNIVKNTCSTTEIHLCTLTVEESTDVDLTIFPCDRAPGEKDSRDLCIIIIERISANKVKFKSAVKSSKRKISPFVHCDANLKPGSYFVLCCSFNRWNSNARDSHIEGRLSCFFSRRARLCCLKVPNAEGILADALIQMILEKYRSGDCNRKQIIKNSVHAYYVSKNWSGIIVMVENKSENNICVVCDSKESTNVTTTRSDFKTQDVIPSNHRQIIQILSQVEISKKFTIHHVLQTSKADKEIHDPPLVESVSGLHCPRPITF
ncbi:DgyrCDS6094 [Dimorphilus gyrociliatus]|uniref:DgyrCDS6094 n=1 Tax=Dimorphilus gyrociliatus TaxID=2664684 RepID=A0A7I8VRT7_9ANNE|nr:DgyrCDS6094 [Dimorphilus gyrociliatus]